MSHRIDEIEGIGSAYGTKLEATGISNTDDLLERCGSAKGRKAVAEETDISAKLLLTWANHADLMRISGIGPQNAELLEAVGVDTVKELRTRNADNLAVKMTEINEQKQLTKATISAKKTADWVAKAKELEPRISH